ncbi:hypothetical protein F5888DRAFT_1692862, partial [Russula emetica]
MLTCIEIGGSASAMSKGLAPILVLANSGGTTGALTPHLLMRANLAYLSRIVPLLLACASLDNVGFSRPSRRRRTLFGVLWNWTLYGVLVVQIYVYSYNFQDDRKPLKLLVYSMFLLETLQTALSVLFVYRVWVLSDMKSWWYCVLIAVCATLDTIGAFAGGIYAHVLGRFISGRSLQIVALIWLIGNTVTDLLIVAAMLYYLTRRRNADKGPWCNHALVKIVRLTIESNMMTTTNSVIALLMVAILPHKLYYTCPTAILGKLYSNTLLVSLNNRISIREVSLGRGALLTSGIRPTSMAKDGPSIVHLEIEKPPCAFEERKQSVESVEDDGREGVI